MSDWLLTTTTVRLTLRGYRRNETRPGLGPGGQRGERGGTRTATNTATWPLSLSLSCCNTERDRDTNIRPLVVLLVGVIRAQSFQLVHQIRSYLHLKAYISLKRNYILLYNRAETRFSFVFPPCDYQWIILWMRTHSNHYITSIFLFQCLQVCRNVIGNDRNI